MTEPRPSSELTSPGGRSSRAEIDLFLDNARRVAAPGAERARLVFALDATMSRAPTWRAAQEVQAGMFEAAAAIGGLSVQLAYFRGIAECRASRWVADARELARLMSGITVRGGQTQIGRVLAHVRGEGGRVPVAALVYVGDAVEEPADELFRAAGELGLLGTRAFMFHEGHDPRAACAFDEIARLTGGAALRFDAAAPASLEALLRAVAAYAAGGRPALSRLASSDGGARRLIEAMPS